MQRHWFVVPTFHHPNNRQNFSAPQDRGRRHPLLNCYEPHRGMVKMAKRGRWKAVAVLAAVLMVGAAGTCLWISKMRERKEFVSNAVDGYRFRCTLSPDWRFQQNVGSNPQNWMKEYVFSPSRSPLREWLATHLFLQPPSTGNIVNQRPRLILGLETRIRGGYIDLRSGYPELAAGSHTKHFRIDNCPATITELDMLTIGIPGNYPHYSYLLVCTPDYQNTYYVVSAALPPYSDQIDREMQAIISSVHIERVSVGTSGKR